MKNSTPLHIHCISKHFKIPPVCLIQPTNDLLVQLLKILPSQVTCLPPTALVQAMPCHSSKRDPSHPANVVQVSSHGLQLPNHTVGQVTVPTPHCVRDPVNVRFAGQMGSENICQANLVATKKVIISFLLSPSQIFI